jgi:hypothetical protein
VWKLHNQPKRRHHSCLHLGSSYILFIIIIGVLLVKTIQVLSLLEHRNIFAYSNPPVTPKSLHCLHRMPALLYIKDTMHHAPISASSRFRVWLGPALQETIKFMRPQIAYDSPLVSYLTYDGLNSALVDYSNLRRPDSTFVD